VRCPFLFRKMKISYGIKMMLLAVLTFSMMNVFVKMLPHIPTLEIVFFRALVSLILSAIILMRKRISFWGNNKKVLLLRGIFGTVALSLYFYTLQVMPLASAMVIHYMSPIFTAIIASIFLKEHLAARQYFFFLISFIGIVSIKGFDARLDWMDVAAGVGAAALSGAAYNCIRWLKFTEDSHVIIFYFPLIAMPSTLLLTLFVYGWVTPGFQDLLLLIAIGVLTQIAQIFLTKAYQSEMANKVAGITNTGIIYALGLGWIFFDEVFDWKVIAGMFLVIGGVLANLVFGGRRS